MTTISASHHDLKPVETAEGNIRFSLFCPDVGLAVTIELTPYDAGVFGLNLVKIGASLTLDTLDRPAEGTL